MNFLKKLIRTKPLNTKQCPAGLSARILPHCPHKHSWETLEMGENPTQHPKNVLIYSTRKVSLMKFTSSTIKSVIPSP